MAEGDYFSRESGDGLTTRIAVLEDRCGRFDRELGLLKRDDLGDIKRDIRGLRDDFSISRQGLSRGEKISIALGAIALMSALVGVGTFVLQAVGA